MKNFSEKDIQKLIETPDEKLLEVFPDYTRKILREIKRKNTTIKSEIDFCKFLLKAKTKEEIFKKFGDQTDYLLSQKYEGLSLFQQRNFYNELVYILLPEINNEIKIEKKIWQAYIGKSEKGEIQPYVLYQFPKTVFTNGKFNIVPLFDVHYGHSAFKREKFLSYIRWIKETPNIFTVLGGDILENAIDDGRGMMYDQQVPPEIQANEMIELLAPIAHKILIGIRGNHEARSFKKAGIDPLKYVCDRLNIIYFDGPVILSILAAEKKWLIYLWHGKSTSQTKGGKLNAAGRARNFTGLVHFYVSGHTHDPMANSETIIIENPTECRLDFLQQWVCVASSFIGWENTYAWRAGYSPPGKGGLLLEMESNGNYRAYLK